MWKVFVDTIGVVTPLTTWKLEDTDVYVGKTSASQKFAVKSVRKDRIISYKGVFTYPFMTHLDQMTVLVS